MITLTPLSGSSSSATPTTETPVCYLLELDEVRILLDLGGYDPRATLERSVEYEDRIRQLSPTIHLVLLSHSSSQYLSLYPYARTHWGLRAPVYATQPTVEMGRVVCLEEAMDWRGEVGVEDEDLDVERSEEQAVPDGIPDGPDGHVKKEDTSERQAKPTKPPFLCTPDQINESFNHIKAVRYSQPIHLPGTLSHLLLTPYPSGHTLGGTIFKLRSPTSGTILYAVGMNHTKERGLDPTVLLGGEFGSIWDDERLCEARGWNTSCIESGIRQDIIDVLGGNRLDQGSEIFRPDDQTNLRAAEQVEQCLEL